MIQFGGGRAAGSTCKVRSYATSKFLPVADTCAQLSREDGGDFQVQRLEAQA